MNIQTITEAMTDADPEAGPDCQRYECEAGDYAASQPDSPNDANSGAQLQR